MLTQLSTCVPESFRPLWHLNPEAKLSQPWWYDRSDVVRSQESIHSQPFQHTVFQGACCGFNPITCLFLKASPVCYHVMNPRTDKARVSPGSQPTSTCRCGLFGFRAERGQVNLRKIDDITDIISNSLVIASVLDYLGFDWICPDLSSLCFHNLKLIHYAGISCSKVFCFFFFFFPEE